MDLKAARTQTRTWGLRRRSCSRKIDLIKGIDAMHTHFRRMLVAGAFTLTLGLLPIDRANAVLLTFDDVPGGSVQGTFGDMPTYQGFNFSFTLDWIDLVGTVWPHGAHSGDWDDDGHGLSRPPDHAVVCE